MFNRHLKTKQRDFSANLINSQDYDYLRIELANRLVDRLKDIKSNFDNVLDIGCHRGQLLDSIINESNENVFKNIKTYTQVEISNSLFSQAQIKSKHYNRIINNIQTLNVDENYLPFQSQSFDLIMSSMYLHWSNDLQSNLNKIYNLLKPNGCFMCCLIGGNSTLFELKHSLMLAESERKAGFSPHTSPYPTPSEIAALIQNSGFALPTIDVDTITVIFIQYMFIFR